MQENVEMGERETVRALFERLADRGPEPALRRSTGTCEFDIDNCGRWYVTLAGGAVSVSEDPRPATCTLTWHARDFVDVVEGRQNLMTAFLRGRFKATGDLALGLSLRHLLPVSR
jgi:predicted lipid carrier protein YhbT